MTSSPESRPSALEEESEARSRLRAERDQLQRERTRHFLIAQTSLLGIAMAAVATAGAFGAFAPELLTASLMFCVVMGGVTGAGWWWFRQGEGYRSLSLALLYVDSVLGLLFFYVAGEFETPSIAMMGFIIIMAPIYVGKRAAWGIATTQLAVFVLLLLARHTGVMDHLLPYGFLIAEDAVMRKEVVFDVVVGFTIAVFGFAYLAGQASIDILNSQDQLEREVASKTRELARARDSLEAANDNLADANLALADANHRLEDANEQLAHANDQLAHANDQLHLSHGRLEQFNAAVGHDLKAPLQTLMGRAELIAMAGTQNPERVVRMAEDIADTAERMSKQIDELLKLSKVGDRLGDLERVAIAEVVGLAGHDVSDRMRAAGATLEIVHPLPAVRGNPALLKELFQNLFENSVKYGNPEGARIRVAAAGDTDRAVVVVEDDGPGIPEERRESVFGLFKRLPDHRQHEGVGAGLAIVKRIVEVHGGTVRIEDGQDLPGARFIVALQPWTAPRPDAAEPATVH